MSEYKFNNLSPFKFFILETFPFIQQEYFDAMNEWQMFCKVGEKINELINSQNSVGQETETLYNAFIQLQKYINNYFTDLNIQDEINNKLNDMTEDGTLAEIINENIFNELNNKVDTLQEDYEKTKIKNNIYLGAFFNGTTEKINFCVSNDGINFSDILPNVDISGRDPNILYNPANKTFYLCVTGSGTTWDFTCYTSQDLINWNRHYISLGILTGIRWAPELFLDKNGDLWATITAGSENNLSLFKAKCNNIELLTFNTRTAINLSQQNIIDSNIIYNDTDENYYLTCKNDTTSLQLIYSSSDLENWTLINDNVLKTGEQCEGGFMIKTNNKFTFYGDTWQSFGYVIMGQSENPSNFNNFTRPNSLMNKRHGSICFIEDQEAVALITNLESYKQMKNINNITSREYNLSGNIENLIVYPNFIYRVTANTTINNLINAYDLKEMPFYFAGNRGLTLIINNVINSEVQTKTINKVINNSTYSNEKLNFITLIGNPVIKDNSNFEDIAISDIIINPGWEVSIYSFKRFKDLIHIDGDIRKTANATSDYAFTINNNEIKPTFHKFSTTSQGKTIWLNTDGSLVLLGAEVGNQNFISLEYLCI